MDTRIKNIITSIILLIAFFLPWIKVFGFGGSAFDLIMQFFDNIKFVEKEPTILFVLLLLIFPISGLIVLIHYAKTEIKQSQLGGIRFAKKAPLILIITAILFTIVKFNKELKHINGNDITQILNAGVLLTVIASIVLFVDKTTPFSNSKDTSEENKEEVNTDDLFK